MKSIVLQNTSPRKQNNHLLLIQKIYIS